VPVGTGRVTGTGMVRVRVTGMEMVTGMGMGMVTGMGMVLVRHSQPEPGRLPEQSPMVTKLISSLLIPP